VNSVQFTIFCQLRELLADISHRNQTTYPTTNDPTPNNAMGICALGVNVAKARVTIPAIVRLSGFRPILCKRFLLGLRFGAVPENVSNTFGILIGAIFRGTGVNVVISAGLTENLVYLTFEF